MLVPVALFLFFSLIFQSLNNGLIFFFLFLKLSVYFCFQLSFIMSFLLFGNNVFGLVNFVYMKCVLLYHRNILHFILISTLKFAKYLKPSPPHIVLITYFYKNVQVWGISGRGAAKTVRKRTWRFSLDCLPTLLVTMTFTAAFGFPHSC